MPNAQRPMHNGARFFAAVDLPCDSRNFEKTGPQKFLPIYIFHKNKVVFLSLSLFFLFGEKHRKYR
jgi:hypothetical protein